MSTYAENVKGNAGIEKKIMKNLAREDAKTIKSSLDDLLKAASNGVKRYIAAERQKPESTVSDLLNLLRDIEEHYYVKPKLFVLPSSIEKLSRILDSNLVEDVQRLMGGDSNPLSYTLESALFKCIGNALVKKVSNVANELKFEDQHSETFGELLAGIHFNIEEASNDNHISAESWFKIGNYYAMFLNTLMLMSAKEIDVRKSYAIETNELLGYPLKTLLDMGFVLDSDELESMWNTISDKYKFEGYSPELKSIAAISRLTGMHDAEVLTNGIVSAYISQKADGTFLLEVFIVTEVARAIIDKAFELINIMEGVDADFDYAFAQDIMKLSTAINKTKVQNKIDEELPQLMGTILKFILTGKQQRSQNFNESFQDSYV